MHDKRFTETCMGSMGGFKIQGLLSQKQHYDQKGFVLVPRDWALYWGPFFLESPHKFSFPTATQQGPRF